MNYYDKALNERFSHYIRNNWEMNDHNLKDISCVYAILSLDPITKYLFIDYIGSTTKLFSRYKSHSVPQKIQNEGNCNILFFKKMNRGFYDYEIKLIKKLQPKFNKQHK